MKNKGQTLVAFLLILPFITLFIGFIFDIGYINIEKRRMENVLKNSIQYGLKNKENENVKYEIETLIKENVSDIEKIDITLDDVSLKIELTSNLKSIYSIIHFENIYKIKVTYKGYLENEKIKIIKG